jgi:copper(I)-binding protein
MKKILLLTLFALCTFTARADTTAPYTFSNAVIREAPAKIAAAYITVTNPTAQNDTLIGAKADWADHIEMHHISMDDKGVMDMSPIKEIALPAHDKAELKQGATHLMIFGVKEKLSVDQKKDITLLFKKAGALTVPFDVQPIGNIGQQAQQQDMSHDHMNMKGM